MRTVLGSNLVKLLAARYADIKTDTARVKALAKAARIGHGTIQRALTGETAATLDTIERLALALDVSVYQLLLPNLDPKNPQVVRGATAEEQHLYANIRKERAGLRT